MKIKEIRIIINNKPIQIRGNKIYKDRYQDIRICKCCRGTKAILKNRVTKILNRIL